jgi:tetratricopeptide (TPR) repeat protein
MDELDRVTRAMRDSNDLWQQGEPRKALKLLDQSIAEAVQEEKTEWIQALCRHAALISDSLGDLALCQQYNEQALAYGPNNPMALYGLAKVLSMQGQTELAKQYALRCHEVVVRSANDAHRGILDLIAKRWPEISKH